MTPAQLVFDFVRTAAPTLDGFIVGRNAEALETLRALVSGASTERSIYFWGAPGSGRTHLLRASVEAVELGGADASYIACERDTVLTPSLVELTLIAIDDVERLGAEGQLALFNLYNERRERGLALLAAGNKPPAQLGLRDDVVTRLGWGLVYEVHGLSDADKGDALMQQARARGFKLRPDVREYLLQRVQRDMPSLLAMLDALDRYSLAAKRPITVPLVRELMCRMKNERGGA